MQLSEIQKRVSRLAKRFTSKAYAIKEYFDLTNEHRQIILDDFNELVSITNELILTTEKDWHKLEGEQFKDNFTRSWLLYYISSKFIKAVGTSSVIDTFLNNPLDGKRGALATFREKIMDPKYAVELLKGMKQSLKHQGIITLMDTYRIPIESVSINARKLIKYRLFHLYLPLQIFIAERLAKPFRFKNRKELITDEQLSDLEPHLEAGDILLQRTNFKLTNITLPGFWTHTMIYDGQGNIIEAKPNHVRIIAWKKTAKADYLCVLRPKCPTIQKENAIKYAKAMIGKKYDFDFDFLSDEGFACSDLVLKAYPHFKPELRKIMGHMTYPPSNFIKLFNEGKLDYVYFLDGKEKKKRALLSPPSDLATSHLRSKWDLK